MLKGFSDIFQAMKQAQAIQGRFAELQSKLAELRVEGAAGGGMVTVTMDGQQRLVACRIEPGLISSGDREMLEDLVCAAVNQAAERSREAATEMLGSLVEGVDISGIKNALAGLRFPGPTA